MFRRIIQVYLESVFNNEIVAWYIFYLNRRPGLLQNYPSYLLANAPRPKLAGLNCSNFGRVHIIAYSNCYIDGL